MSWLLIHSPLVGPLTWSSTADIARRRGVEVTSPDLTAAAGESRPSWERLVDFAVSATNVDDGVTVIGHSGAGAFLPQIGHRLGRGLAGLVFVDSVVPPSSGFHVTSGSLASLLDEQTEAGLLKNWFDWWPPGVVEELVPDANLAGRLRDDAPRVSRTLYDEPIPVPDGWERAPTAYLRLSPAYETSLDEARRRGWRTAVLDGTHLSMVTTPELVVDAILGLESQAGA